MENRTVVFQQTTARCGWAVIQEMAEAEGDLEHAEDLRLELEDLENRAKELDNRRTITISGIRSLSSSDLHSK